MTFQAWYRRRPERLEEEKEAYRQAGLDFNLREDLFNQHSVVIFEGTVQIGGAARTLVVVYPSGFPYFRPEVIARDASLGRHQNPYARNLCVIPNKEWAWRPTDHGAHIVEQAMRLLDASQQGPDVVAQ